MTETTGQRRRAPGMSPEQRRDMIVRAALPLVAEFGMAVTTQQVARAAGIGEATIFRVFVDKDALIDACLVEALDSTHVLSELRSIPLDQPLAARLVEAVDAMRAFLGRMGLVMGALHATGRAPRRPELSLHRSPPPPPAGPIAPDGSPPPTAPDGSSQPDGSVGLSGSSGSTSSGSASSGSTSSGSTAVEGGMAAFSGNGRAVMFAETREAIVDLLEPDAASLRLPAEKLTDLFVGLVFGMRRMPGAEGEELTPEELVDLFLNGVLTD